MVSLGQHLCPDQQSHFTPIYFIQRVFQRAAPPHGIAIDARHRHPGKQLFERFLDTLRTLADRLDRFAAVRTGFRQGLPGAAVMAMQLDG